jgi:rubrerythrin
MRLRLQAPDASNRLLPIYLVGQCSHATLTIMTCKVCRISMQEVKGHVFHKKRKWRCPRCKRVRMQKPR